MQDIYGIAAFRSRQQVLRFEDALHREGIACRVVTTPRAVALGCGLSVRFDMENAEWVRAVLKREKPNNLIGMYRVEYAGTRANIAPIGI